MVNYLLLQPVYLSLLLQMRNDSGNQWNGGGYHGRQNYGGYGYGASQNQDSGMYAAGASSNGYGNQQPVS